MTSETQDFRVKCREFIDHLVFVLLESVTVTSGVAQGLYSFCPDIMLRGDDQDVFELFSYLCQLFDSCNVLCPDEVKAAKEDFRSYVIEKQRQYLPMIDIR